MNKWTILPLVRHDKDPSFAIFIQVWSSMAHIGGDLRGGRPHLLTMPSGGFLFSQWADDFFCGHHWGSKWWHMIIIIIIYYHYLRYHILSPYHYSDMCQYFRRNKVYASWKLYKTPISVNHGSHFQVRFVWQVWDGQLSPSFKHIRF